MPSFALLPNEILNLFIKHLLDRKIHDFDLVAIRDLQNVRLVCRTVCRAPHFTMLQRSYGEVDG